MLMFLFYLFPRHRLPICNFQETNPSAKKIGQACNRHVDRSACQFYSCNNCRTEERWLLCLPTSYPFLLKVHLQEVYRTLHDGQPAYSVSANDPYIPAVPGFRFLFQICAASIPDSSLTAVFLLFLPFLSEYFFTAITIVAHLYFNCYPVPIRSISNDC